MRRISLRSIFTAVIGTAFFLLLIFVATNSNENFDENKLSSIKCNCPEKLPYVERVTAPKTEKNVEVKVETSTAESTTTVPPLPPCQPVSNTSAVQRAIIIYYPHHQAEYFFPELKW